MNEIVWTTIKEALRQRRESLQYMLARDRDFTGRPQTEETINRWNQEVFDIRAAESWLGDQAFGKDGEIIEEGIKHIAVAYTDELNQLFDIKDGWAKWFRDELGQVWVKFNNTGGSHYVIPADRVREVAYQSPRA